MSGSLGKRILKWTALTVPWLLALGLAVGWGLAEWTPGYLERLVPKLAADMGVPLSEFHIRDAGLFSADIGPLRIGPKHNGVQLNNVRVTYTPASLSQGRVNEIILDGVSLHCSYDGTTFNLPFLDLLPKSAPPPPSKDSTKPPFDSLAIKDSTLNVHIPGKDIAIPFYGTVTPVDSIRFDMTLRPRDQRMVVYGGIGPTSSELICLLKLYDFDLAAINDLLPMPVRGRITSTTHITVNTADLETLEASTDLSLTDAALPGHNLAFAQDSPLSAKAHISGKTATFSLAPATLTAPYPMTVGIAEGHVSEDSLSANFTVKTLGVDLPGTLKAQRKDGQWDTLLTVTNKNSLNVETGGRTIRLTGFDFSINGQIAPTSADVTVQTSTSSATLGGTGLRCGAIAATLPLKWPAPKRHTPGKLRISNLRHGDRAIGTASATVRQENMGLALAGTLFSNLLPDLKVPFSGKGAMNGPFADFSFAIDKYTLPANFDLNAILPDIHDVRVSGVLAAEGGIRLDNGDIDSRLGLYFTGGTLAIGADDSGAAGTTLTGVRLFFESPDLIDFRSAPAQVFAFDSLQSGAVRMRNGKITFQLEPRGVTLVERMRLKWCGGKVESRAFRIVPGKNDYDITLFCSELRLTALLTQLGLAEAHGEAALSGELPVLWKDGKIFFQNGFLHSTPGQGGTIKVDAMQDLVASMPKGTPERMQLELAQEAVRNFEYKWVRIKADTVGEDLLVRLSVDGKPASTLPFVYSKEFGGFARVTGDFAGSNFQGLRLDVNFSLPLDRILLYKDIIDMIE